MSVPKSDQIQQTLFVWRDEVRSARDNHYDCERYFSQIDSVLKWAGIILSALVGTSVFADFTGQSDAAKVSIGLLSFIASGAMTLNTTLKYGERAEKHRVSGAGFQALLDDIEFQVDSIFKNNIIDTSKIESIKETKKKVTADAPGIPDRIYHRKPKKAPHCPKCNSLMVLKTAKKGANQGKQFWGCSRYPDCDGSLDYV